jgi:hypothetical protein
VFEQFVAAIANVKLKDQRVVIRKAKCLRKPDFIVPTVANERLLTQVSMLHISHRCRMIGLEEWKRFRLVKQAQQPGRREQTRGAAVSLVCSEHHGIPGSSLSRSSRQRAIIPSYVEIRSRLSPARGLRSGGAFGVGELE